MMDFEDLNAGADSPPTPPPPPAQAPAKLHEPLWLLLLGVALFLLLLTMSWRRDAQHPQLRILPVQQAATISTYIVEYLQLQQLKGPSTGIRTAFASALPQSAAQAADNWDTIVEKATDTKLGTPDPALGAKAALNAAVLRGVAGDQVAAQTSLTRAIGLRPSQAAIFRELMPLYAQPSRAVTLSAAARAYLRDSLAEPLILARSAQLAGNNTAAIAALRPGATAGRRLMILNGVIALLGAVLFITVVILLIVYYRRIQQSIAITEQPESSPPAWGPGAALIVISAVYLLASVVAYVGLHLLGGKAADTRMSLLASAPATIISAIIVLGVFLSLHGRGFWEWHIFGWRATRRGVGYGMLTLLLAFPLIWIVLMISAFLFRDHLESHPLIPLLLHTRDPWLIVLLALMAVVMAPIVEETLFRGLLFRALDARVSFWGAAVISGVLFALVHGQLVAILPIVVLGVIFAFLTRRTESLWASAGAHAMFNGLNTLIVLFTAWALHSA